MKTALNNKNQIGPLLLAMCTYFLYLFVKQEAGYASALCKLKLI